MKIKNFFLEKLGYLTWELLPVVKKSWIKSLKERNHPLSPLFLPEFRKRFFEIHPKIRKKFIENLLFRGVWRNQKIRDKAAAEGSAPLTTLLISPSMRCNLSCVGCYAKNYSKETDMPFELFDRIITEAKKDIGVVFFTILGGEPFIREDIFEIFKKHSDAYFQVFTNGTLIDEKIAQKLLDCGNVFVNFSIEGFEKETDEIRGKGVYQKLMKAMDILRERKIPFGYSVHVMRKNAETVVSDEFVEFMVKKGAFIGWYFLHMPVNGDKNTELMPTPEQRNNQRLRRNEIRKKFPIFIIDFWNDAPFVGGCISAKYYSHVNNFGDLEPCIFTHFSQVNIKNLPLKEALKCQFFKEIRKRQPFSQNLLMPCPLIDHPYVIRELCQVCKISPTHPGARTLIEDLKEPLDQYSQKVHQIYDQVWQEIEIEFGEKLKKDKRL
jgi:MoaA/NifB/PqqE/SkfB family radical SAM enzyme